MPRKKNIFIKGLPIKAQAKLLVISILFVVLIINQLLPAFIPVFDYALRGFVSMGLLVLIVVFSVGNKLTEGLVIGLTLFIIMSSIWDLNVRDISDLRKNILIGSFAVLFISLLVGEISITNLVSIIRRQLGVKK